MGGCENPIWNQFHGGEDNLGYLAVHSNTRPIPAWNNLFAIGYVSFSSPAIWKDGTIYVGTYVGALAAIKPDGSAFQWIVYPPVEFDKPCIVSSPAVSFSGDIYYILSHKLPKACDQCNEHYDSRLIKVNGRGVIDKFFDFDQPAHFGTSFTTTSPKILNFQNKDFIFIQSRDKVFVFDDNLQVLTTKEVECSGDLKNTGITRDYDRFDNLNPQDGPHFFDDFILPDEFAIDPTIAVTQQIDNRKLEHPLVAVATVRCGLEVFEWIPPPNSRLEFKWFEPRTFEDLLSSPAISTSGEVVIGTKDGWMFSYEIETGKDNWILNLHEPVISSPAFYGGVQKIFIAGLNHVFSVENGSVVSQFELPAPTLASVALSMDRVIVSTPLGTFFITPDLNSFAKDQTITGGMSSPAIGRDGSVYIISNAGRLMCFQKP